MKTLRSLRSKLVPLDVDVTDVTLDASYKGEPLFSLDQSQIHHNAGEEKFNLDLGTLTDATGREWGARDTELVWEEDKLAIDRLDPLPGIGLRDLELGLPETGGPSLDTELLVDDAVFTVNASRGFNSVQVNLREGKLDSGELAERFKLDLPASGELSSFSAKINQLLPNPKDATGEARMLLENVRYQDWTVPELGIDVALQETGAKLAARGQALNSEFSLTADAGIARPDGGFRLGEVAGNFEVAQLSEVVPALGGRFGGIDAAAKVPAATVSGSFQAGFEDNRPQTARVDVSVKPEEPESAAGLDLDLAWSKSDEAVSLNVATEGVRGHADFDMAEASYDARMDFEDFTSAGITPWLRVAKLGTDGKVSLTGTWRGSGDLDTQTHKGNIDLASADVSREGMPPIHAEGEVSYDWPGGFSTKDLLVRTDDQVLTTDVRLDDGFLELEDLIWKEGGTEMATGSAKIPVPEDFSKWREALANDKRPVRASIQSKDLPLAALKDWLPAASKLAPGSTGNLDVNVSGTFAQPEIDANLSLKDLRSPDKPKIPPTDVELDLTARDGQLSLAGTATAPDIPPAKLSASMPFRPAEWARNPESIKKEKITGRVDLPRLDVSRFGSLVPSADKLTGTVSGNIEIGGELGDPLAKGRLDVAGGGLDMKGESLPPIKDLNASVDLGTDQIKLDKFSTNIAGGILTGSGTLALENGKPGNMDLRLKGDHLLLRRDESLILRANANLQVTGTWEQARVSGTLGVVDSLFFRDIELLPIGSPFTVPSAAELPKIDTATSPTSAVPEPFRNWSLDVTLRDRRAVPDPWQPRHRPHHRQREGRRHHRRSRTRRRGADLGFHRVAAVQHAHCALGHVGVHAGIRHRSTVGNPRHGRAAAIPRERICIRKRIRSAACSNIEPAAAGE